MKELSFAWWCPCVIRKFCSLRRLYGAKSKYWLKSHKYGVKLPKSIKEALQIGAKIGTTFWRDTIAKEMKHVMVTFEFNNEDKIPVGHRRITVHMVFDVKITLQQKARLVADGNS